MADLTQLDPSFLLLVNKWVLQTSEAGLHTRITVTWRDDADQNQCEAEGLSNAAAGQSPHNCINADGNPSARAFDFAVFDGQTYVTDGADPRYDQAGQIAKTLGMVWGGDWHHPDYDHIEMANWRGA